MISWPGFEAAEHVSAFGSSVARRMLRTSHAIALPDGGTLEVSESPHHHDWQTADTDTEARKDSCTLLRRTGGVAALALKWPTVEKIVVVEAMSTRKSRHSDIASGCYLQVDEVVLKVVRKHFPKQAEVLSDPRSPGHACCCATIGEDRQVS